MLRRWPLLGVLAALTALALACNGGGDGGGNTPSAGATPTGGSTVQPTSRSYSERPDVTISRDGKYTAIVSTTKGQFKIELRPDLALETVNSFIFLAREGYFDGVTFHRVLPGFVAQTGDPTGTGSGDPGYSLPAEFSETPYVRGTVGMARTSDPNSAGSQWFVTYNDQYQNALNGQYTVFGMVSEGMDVVDALTPRDPSAGAPLPEGDQITGIEIVEG